MARFQLLPAAVYLLLATVNGQFENLHFSSELEEYQCPSDFGLSCNPPEVCARHRLLDKYYCCMPGEGGICWTPSTACEGQGERQPSSSQIGCGSGENAFCCLARREECTQTTSQINICWATPENPLANISSEDMSELYSALVSESPSATAYPVELGSLLPSSRSWSPAPTSIVGPTRVNAASITPFMSSSDSSQTPTSTPTTAGGFTPNQEPPTARNPPSSGLSRGAIACIVVGIAGGVALVCVAIFLLWRRKKYRGHELDGTSYTDRFPDGVVSVREKYAQDYHGAYPPVELATERPLAEMQTPNKVHEMDAPTRSELAAPEDTAADVPRP